MRITVFTTGGTIDKVYHDALSDYTIGEPMAGGILQEARASFDYEIKELMRKDSLDLLEEDRATIRNAVEADPAGHVLITHGTDTMAQTAEALAGIPAKTIVLCGAMSPARFRDSDAAFNLGCAIGALQSLPPGVYIAMNGRVFEAGKVRKNRAAGRFEDLQDK